MKKIVLLVLITLSVKVVSSQVQAVVYDQVHMRNGDVLVGEIMLFQESDGDITFRDLDGRTYSITRKEYDFFRENVVVINKSKNDTTIINQRKSIGNVFSAGVSQVLFLNHWDPFIPTTLHVGYGRQLSRKNLVGINLDYSLYETDIKTYVNPSLFIKHQYDAYRTNVSYYIIGELGYAYHSSANSLLYKNGSGSSRYVKTPLKTSYVSIEVGQGFGFILKNSNSISVELVLSKNEMLSQSIEEQDLSGLLNGQYEAVFDVNEKESAFGIGLRVLVNF